MTDWRQYYDDPDAVLREYDAHIVIDDTLITGEGVEIPDPQGEIWYLSWPNGCIYLGRVGTLSKKWAKVQAALFCQLWKIGVHASDADDISCGYAACQQWFDGIQKVYQLQAIGHDAGSDFTPSYAIRSERLWYMREAAEKYKADFEKAMNRKGMQVETVDILVLELRR